MEDLNMNTALNCRTREEVVAALRAYKSAQRKWQEESDARLKARAMELVLS